MIDMESNTTLVQCYPAHEAVPEGTGPFPGLVVAHDRFGLTPHAKGIANRLASAGFYALAPNFYAAPTSVADVAPEFLHPVAATHFDYSREEEASDRAAMLDQERGAEIFRQAIGYAVTRARVRPGGVGLLGFGMGARHAFVAACKNVEEVRAAVCFYARGIGRPTHPESPSASPLDLAADLKAPVLFFYGEVDPEISRKEREAVRERLTELGKDFRMEVFHDTGGDFFCDERETYRIQSSKVAWEETLTFFRRHL
jgi:carboxymethylenebutenolidase